jgi:hypothetical protein
VHPNGGAAVSPYRYLQKARRLLFAAPPGSTFTLALSGTVVSTAAEGVALSVDQVRSWPGGRRVKQAGQKVAVSVPETTAVEGIEAAAAEPTPFSALELLAKGQTITVFTSPAKVTFAAQVGAKGTLAASRVIVRR